MSDDAISPELSLRLKAREMADELTNDDRACEVAYQLTEAMTTVAEKLDLSDEELVFHLAVMAGAQGLALDPDEKTAVGRAGFNCLVGRAYVQYHHDDGPGGEVPS